MINKKTFSTLIIPLLLLSSHAFGQLDSVVWKEYQRVFKSKDYLLCYTLIDDIIKNAPDVSEAYYNKGILLFRMGDKEQSCKYLKQARDMSMKDVNVPVSCDKKTTLVSLNDFFYKGITLDSAFGYRPHYTLKDTLRGMLRNERTCFDVTFYNLLVRIIPRGKKIIGVNRIDFKVLESTKKIQLDLFSNMKIEKIIWNNQELKYSRQFDAVFVDFPQLLPVNSMQQITVSYKGSPSIAANPPWGGGFVWKRDKDANEWVGVSCEHFGASCWWPNKDHLSDEPDSMRINIEVPKAYQAISNGTLEKIERVKGNYNRYCWLVHYPINNYNVTFYMAKFEQISDTLHAGKDIIKLDYYVLPQDTDKAVGYFNQTKLIVSTFNDLFGTFPFIKDKFCLVESPFSGMEHQSAIALGSDFGKVHSHDYPEGNYDQLIVHEAAHEWWGNSVSCGDMAEAWIHEAFATYAELLFLEKVFGYEKGYLPQLRRQREQIMNFWPMVHNFGVNEYSFASNDIYIKGSAMLDNLRCTINNDSIFFKLIKDFHTRYQCKVIVTNDFIQMVNEYTKEDYTSFFKKFLYDTSLPVLKYSYKKEASNILFTYRWDGVAEGFRMPFCIRYDNDQVKRIDATSIDQTITLTNTSTFNFYTTWVSPKGCLKNTYTYFWTKKIE